MRTAAEAVPPLVTAAEEPAEPVVTVPTETVAPPPVPLEAEMTRPLASTVIFADVYEPAVTPEVASVLTELPEGLVTSPVKAGSCVAASVPDKSTKPGCADPITPVVELYAVKNLWDDAGMFPGRTEVLGR